MKWLPSLAAMLVLGFGCRSTGASDASTVEESAGQPEEQAGPADVQRNHAGTEEHWEIAGRSVEDRPIELARFGEGECTVLILASIHGDEAAGTPLLHELAKRLAKDPALTRDRTVLLVPEVNPDGVAKRWRRNAHAVDLNRNFPATNRRSSSNAGPTALSEPESRAIAALIEEWRPDRVLSIHQPARQLDYDGPAQALAEAMGAVTSLPVERMGSRPGSLGSWVGVDMEIPIITVELPDNAERLDDDAAWELFGPLLLQAIRFPEIIESRL